MPDSDSAHALAQGADMAKRLVGVLEALQEVGQDDAWPEGLAETAEDLASARVMNHPVRASRTAPPLVVTQPPVRWFPRSPTLALAFPRELSRPQGGTAFQEASWARRQGGC